MKARVGRAECPYEDSNLGLHVERGGKRLLALKLISNSSVVSWAARR